MRNNGLALAGGFGLLLLFCLACGQSTEDREAIHVAKRFVFALRLSDTTLIKEVSTPSFWEDIRHTLPEPTDLRLPAESVLLATVRAAAAAQIDVMVRARGDRDQEEGILIMVRRERPMLVRGAQFRPDVGTRGN